MRIRFFVLALIAISSTACKDVTAPNPAGTIELAPFSTASINVIPGGTYVQFMSFYAPAGVDPQIDVTVTDITKQSPELKIQQVFHQIPSDQLCTSNCTRQVWTHGIFFTTSQVGEALITFSLHGNPKQSVSLRVISDFNYTKG
jgi:hypothetical protein